jgi:LCP family protein required for cell wall assembly
VKTRRKPRSPLWAKMCVVLGAIFLLVSGTAYGGFLFTERYDNNIKRSNLLPATNLSVKATTAEIKGPLNILVIGSDSRAKEKYDPNDPSLSAAAVGGARSDTIMLVHIGANLDRAYGISFPRDAYVDIPPLKGKWGGGKNKINAAYAIGGAPHLVKTIQGLSGLTVNHVVMVDFSGLRKVTDAVGGVDVYIDKETRDPYRPARVFKKGLNHLDGKAAEAYVRQRMGLKNGDYDRVKRQQQYLHALMQKVTTSGVVANPAKLDALLMAVTDSFTVDQSMRVKDLAFAMRTINPTDVTFMTLPMIGGDKRNGIWYELVDEPGYRELFAAIKAGTLDTYMLQHPPNEVTHGA